MNTRTGDSAAVPRGAERRLERLVEWASRRHGSPPTEVHPIAGDAGLRRYFRLGFEDGTRVLMDAPGQPLANIAFRHVAALLHGEGLRAPRIHAADDALGAMLLSDLGPTTYLETLEACSEPSATPWERRPDARARERLDAAVEALVRWQAGSRPQALPPYDAATLRAELDLFATWYAGRHRGAPGGGTSPQWQRHWERLAERVVAETAVQPAVFVHRDYMPRNLTPADGLPGILDFQDALFGPVTYDVVSLFRDAFISWPWAWVEERLVDYRARAARAGVPVHGSDRAFLDAAAWMAVQRHLKVLGIFARLHYRDGKPRYLADAPRFLGYLRETAARHGDALDALLRPVLDPLEEDP